VPYPNDTGARGFSVSFFGSLQWSVRFYHATEYQSAEHPLSRPLSTDEIASRRNEICDAAVNLFTQYGVEGVTMRAIAAEMGASTMKPYHYFKDKNEILAAVLARAFDRFVSILDAAGEIEGTAYERARSKRYAFSHFALRESDSYRLMFVIAHPKESDYPGMAEAMNRTRASMRRSVEELIADGLVCGDPNTLGHAFWCAIHGPLSLYLAGKLDPEVDVEETIDRLILGLFAGLKP
jgi:AcrR family transcriptional regulator